MATSTLLPDLNTPTADFRQPAHCSGHTRAANRLPDAGEVRFRRGIHRAEQVVELLDRVALAMTTLGYSLAEVFGVRLAIEEAVVNGVKHGHRGDPSKTVRIDCHIDTKRALIRVADEGAGFDPAQVANPVADENLERPCGRGLLLIRHYLTWVRYNQRGNRVTLCRRRGAAARRATAGS